MTKDQLKEWVDGRRAEGLSFQTLKTRRVKNPDWESVSTLRNLSAISSEIVIPLPFGSIDDFHPEQFEQVDEFKKYLRFRSSTYFDQDENNKEIPTETEIEIRAVQPLRDKFGTVIDVRSSPWAPTSLIEAYVDFGYDPNFCHYDDDLYDALFRKRRDRDEYEIKQFLYDFGYYEKELPACVCRTTIEKTEWYGLTFEKRTDCHEYEVLTYDPKISRKKAIAELVKVLVK